MPQEVDVDDVVQEVGMERIRNASAKLSLLDRILGERNEATARLEAAEADRARYARDVLALEAELARLRTDISATISERDDALSYVDMIRVAMGGYADSNLASLAETLRKRNDALEAEVEQLQKELEVTRDLLSDAPMGFEDYTYETWYASVKDYLETLDE
jgi:predicted  nucleic acid-binding Zn-ribbon protein